MSKPNSTWWTRERVDRGLERFVRDFYKGNESELPWNFHSYRIAIPEDKRRRVQKLRLYPPFQVIARYYASMIIAWERLGFTVSERSLEYWTRDEVIAGLKRFHADFGFCATSTERYQEHAQFSPRFNKIGKFDPDGAYGKYPSFLCIRKFFGTMREAWTAAGFDVDKWWEPWLPIEDWFIVESCGILPRKEVAEMLKRTVPAVKRRLYDLGRITANTRWGMSVSRAEALMRVPGQMLNRYIKHGVLPCFRGHKNIYVNPADLLKVQEFDWNSKEIDPDLENEVRRALYQRLLKILKFGEKWRDHEIYKSETGKVYHGRIKNPRKSALLENTPKPPNDLKTGDWVKVIERHKQIAGGRLGVVKAVHFSWQKVVRKDGTRRACWMATVEFPKLLTITGEKDRRIRYGIPLDCLELNEKPNIERPPLKQTPEAERSRQRFKVHLARAGNRFQEIKQELS